MGSDWLCKRYSLSFCGFRLVAIFFESTFDVALLALLLDMVAPLPAPPLPLLETYCGWVWRMLFAVFDLEAWALLLLLCWATLCLMEEAVRF